MLSRANLTDSSIGLPVSVMFVIGFITLFLKSINESRIIRGVNAITVERAARAVSNLLASGTLVILSKSSLAPMGITLASVPGIVPTASVFLNASARPPRRYAICSNALLLKYASCANVIG